MSALAEYIKSSHPDIDVNFRAGKIFDSAEDYARSLNHARLHTSHLVIGLSRDATLKNIFDYFGATQDRLLRTIKGIHDTQDLTFTGQVVSGSLDSTLNNAVSRARRDATDPNLLHAGHLMLATIAVAQEDKNEAGGVFELLGMDNYTDLQIVAETYSGNLGYRAGKLAKEIDEHIHSAETPDDQKLLAAFLKLTADRWNTRFNTSLHS